MADSVISRPPQQGEAEQRVRQARRWLAAALAENAGGRRRWGEVKLWHPDANLIALRLAEWLTPLIPAMAPGGSLLGSALLVGTEAWHRGAGTEAERLTTWVRGLLRPLPQLRHWQVVATQSGQRWDAVGEIPLGQFLGQHGPVRVEPEVTALPLVGDDDLRLMIAARLLDHIALGNLAGGLVALVAEAACPVWVPPALHKLPPSG